MNPEIIYDLIGIGIGPFNLGLAALCVDIPELTAIFFDQSSEFNWHPGMMLSSARLQVPFYADLTTVVNPRSKFTYLNFLKEKKRLFRFAIHENNFVTRKEYNEYCRWVCSQLSSLKFNSQVISVEYNEREDMYAVTTFNVVTTQTQTFYGKHIVVGIGTTPFVPECARNLKHPHIIHSSDYLSHKEELLEKPSITVIGSGQSAAEVFYDLLQEEPMDSLTWFTRSERFYPMEYSKLTLEMTSTDYIDFFYSLKPEKRAALLQEHDNVYKGINFLLINEIYDLLYSKYNDIQNPPVNIQANVELRSVYINNRGVEISVYHDQLEESFTHKTDALILATGYNPRCPSFLTPIKNQINVFEDGSFDVSRNYAIDNIGNRVFVQNAELHTHGFSAPDLGMGPYRNATILNTILDYEHFSLEKKIAFQTFGLPSDCQRAS